MELGQLDKIMGLTDDNTPAVSLSRRQNRPDAGKQRQNSRLIPCFNIQVIN